jgi:hypothetical protein
MICPHGIDLINLVAECCRLVNDQLQKVMRCGFASQELELSVYRASPSYHDSQADLELHAQQFSEK